MANMEGKVVIVTGASSGIGRATAILFAKKGASVAITGRNESALAETEATIAKEGGKSVLKCVGDVSKEEDCRKLVKDTVAKFGKLDVLVNNAGAATKQGAPNSSFEQPLDIYDYVNNVNCRSVIAISQEALPHLKKTKGVIVNVSSVGSFRPMHGYTYYQMAKASVDQLMRCMAVELAKDGVRVNNLKSVNPGFIRTGFITAAGLPEQAADMRTGCPEEMAQTILFLASDCSSYITGQAIVADGGISIAPPPTPDALKGGATK